MVPQFADSKGLKVPRWLADEIMSSLDLATLAEMTYKNTDDLLAALQGGISSNINSVIAGLRLTWVAALTCSLSAGAVTGVGGRYFSSGGTWGYAAEANAHFIVVNPLAASIVFAAGSPSGARYDTLQCRPVFNQYNLENRKFKDPGTGVITTIAVDTRYEFGFEYSIKTGTPGVASAPAADAGWIKLAEVNVPTSATAINDTNIKDVRQAATWVSDPGTLVVGTSPLHVNWGVNDESEEDADLIPLGTTVNDSNGTAMAASTKVRAALAQIAANAVGRAAQTADKLASDAPSTYPLGTSWFSCTAGIAAGWPADACTVFTVYLSTTRFFQYVEEKTTGGTWCRRATAVADTWGAFYKDWTELNDGSGSGLDSDLFDGLESALFLFGDNSTGSYNFTGAGNDLNSPPSGVKILRCDGSTVNNPTGGSCLVLSMSFDSSAGFQLAFRVTTDVTTYIRRKSASTWGSWRQVFDSATGGAGNHAFGTGALIANTTGTDNCAFGANALASNTTGVRNNAFGSAALDASTAGSDNNAFGQNALSANTIGNSNNAFGSYALFHNTTGNNNSAFGESSLQANTTGSSNSAFGAGALAATTTGTNNCAFGASALAANTVDNNSAFGANALDANTTGTYNSAFGYNSLTANTTGIGNTAFGYSALAANTIGTSNSAFGTSALINNTIGIENSAFGSTALYSNTTGNYNSAFGRDALVNNTFGSNNCAFGKNALYSNTVASGNNAFGFGALQANTTGAGNCAFGGDALFSNTTGKWNTAIGAGAGSTITTGINNTCLGYEAEPSSASVSNEFTLGNNSVATLRCAVTTITAISDIRDKTDISPLPIGLRFVNALNPVIHRWDKREWYPDGIRDGSKKSKEIVAGFIAQELQSIQKEYKANYLKLVYESNPDKLEATPGNLLPVMIKAIQELDAKVEALMKLTVR